MHSNPIVVIVQKEVTRQACYTKVSSKDYGRLSVLVPTSFKNKKKVLEYHSLISSKTKVFSSVIELI